MDSWVDLLVESQAIRAVYGNSPPNLKEIDLHEVQVRQNGSASLRLRFNIDLPDSPPEKWAQGNFNTVQLVLCLEQLEQLSIKGFASSQRVELTLTKDSIGTHVHIDSDVLQLSALGSFAYVNEMNAYRAVGQATQR